MMRARVVRTVDRGGQLMHIDSLLKRSERSWRTLSDIYVGAREAVRSEEASVHVDAVLCGLSALCRFVPVPLLMLLPCITHTESSTLLRALSSDSMFSFLRCSSAKVRWAVPPLVARAVVGPEGTVGACRLFILSGRPIAVWSSCKWVGGPFSRRRGRGGGIGSG